MPSRVTAVDVTGRRWDLGAPLAPCIHQVTLLLTQTLKLGYLILKHPLEAEVFDVQLHLVDAVLEKHHHAHGTLATLNEAHQSLMVHVLHVVAVDR